MTTSTTTYRNDDPVATLTVHRRGEDDNTVTHIGFGGKVISHDENLPDSTANALAYFATEAGFVKIGYVEYADS